jgi:hypothetical protein
VQGAEIVQSPRTRVKRGTQSSRLARLAQAPITTDGVLLQRIKETAAAAIDELADICQNAEHEGDRTNAGRVLIGAYCQIREAAAELEPKLSTREARVAYMRAAFKDPDDELLEAMRGEREAILQTLESE